MVMILFQADFAVVVLAVEMFFIVSAVDVVIASAVDHVAAVSADDAVMLQLLVMLLLH